MDFKKAFDSVSHNNTLATVKNGRSGISGRLWSWLKTYQNIHVATVCPYLGRVLSGIKWGSILGPLLFGIFINELQYLC